MSVFKRKPAIDLNEVSRYVKDLEHITILRDKCQLAEERGRYNNIIEVMQLVLIEIQK